MGIRINFHLHLILEGSEEETFFDIVKEKGTHDSIELTYFNCGGAELIPAFYQDAISNEEYDLVLCIFDVDYKYGNQNSAYHITLEKLKGITGSEKRALKISFCNNPNILLWYLVGVCKCNEFPKLHCGKSKNTEIMHKFWPKIGNGIETSDSCKKYDAKKWQLEEIKYSYLNDIYSYDDILLNGEKINQDIKTNNHSSNMFQLLKALKEGDIGYFIKLEKDKNR